MNRLFDVWNKSRPHYHTHFDPFGRKKRVASYNKTVSLSPLRIMFNLKLDF